jgi:fructokinase
VHAHLKEGNQVEYDIVRPVAWDYIEMKSELLSLVTNARYFVFGSLASRNEVSRNTLMQLLESNNSTKVLDINLRPPHYEKETLKSYCIRLMY